MWVDWLLADDSWWLWSMDTGRETMRLLVLQGAHLSQDSLVKLEAAILAGPPRVMYRDDIEPERWQSLFGSGGLDTPCKASGKWRQSQLRCLSSGWVNLSQQTPNGNWQSTSEMSFRTG